MDEIRHQPRFRGPLGLAFIGFGLVGAYFLLTEHRAHVFEYLPYVLLMACPLMHLFGHHHHHQHGRSENDSPGKATSLSPDEVNSPAPR